MVNAIDKVRYIKFEIQYNKNESNAHTHSNSLFKVERASEIFQKHVSHLCSPFSSKTDT